MYLVHKTYHKSKWKGRDKMEFNKTIAARQSVRKFTEAQITDEQLKAILEAANAAPACMGQYDHLLILTFPKSSQNFLSYILNSYSGIEIIKPFKYS